MDSTGDETKNANQEGKALRNDLKGEDQVQWLKQRKPFRNFKGNMSTRTKDYLMRNKIQFLKRIQMDDSDSEHDQEPVGPPINVEEEAKTPTTPAALYKKMVLASRVKDLAV